MVKVIIGPATLTLICGHLVCAVHLPQTSRAETSSGLILHKLLFLHLPYTSTEDFVALQAEIITYQGYVFSQHSPPS
jgi:hypothetical protein